MFEKPPIDDHDAHHSASFMARIRLYFLAGILVLAPIGLTLWISISLVQYIDERIIPLIPKRFNPEIYISQHFGLDWGIPGLGVVVLLLGITLVGALAKGVLGKWVFLKSEQLMHKTPLVRPIYKMFKQILETILSNQAQAFRQAVMIEYPRKGCWSMGFVTSDPADPQLTKTAFGADHDAASSKEHLVAVFVPTTPNPTSGFLLFMPKSQIRNLDISVEEAFRLLISVGIVKTGGETGDAIPKVSDQPAPKD
ncbi:MAG: DUF502 domain-containing protein [Alphaproteobacteria bacterium]